jgi:hypothetical protein
VEVSGVKDALYDVAMQNADRYEALARRAEHGSDGELAGFFAGCATRTAGTPRRPGNCSPIGWPSRLQSEKSTSRF